MSIAMYCLIQFYIQLRFDLAEHRPFLKVLAIKLVIFLSFWQSFLISILTSSTLKVVSPTAKISYPDLKVGIPSLLLCLEMMIFAFLHLFAFPYSPYSRGAPPPKYPISSPSINSGMDGPGPNQGGFLGIKAFIDAMNPWDLVKAFARGMKWLFVGRRKRENDSSYKDAAINYNGSNEGVALSGAGGKSDTGYNGAMGLPIANQFRRSNFGMPPLTAQDEEGAGLIAHAQPNPGEQHPGNPYDYGQPKYQDNSNRPYDYPGQDIGSGGGRYGPGRDADYPSSYGRSQAQRDVSPYDQDPRSVYRPDNQSADIGMAIGGDSEGYRSQAPSSQAHGGQRQPRPSEQWKSSGRARSPPSGDEQVYYADGRSGNVI